MATLAGDPVPSAPSPVRPRGAAERRFYTGMVLFSMAVVVAGFSHSFYLRPYVDFPYPKPALSPFVLLHGFAYSAWMVVMLVQAGLVAAGRRDLHRKLGMGGFALGTALLPLTYLVAVWQVARASAPPIATPLDWTVVPLSQIPVMAVALVMGWRTRRIDLQAHKRWMIGFMLMLLEPAVGRLPLGPPSVETNALGSVLAWLPFLALFAWDWRSRGKLHRASVAAAGLALAAALWRNWFLFHPGEWAGIAVFLPGVGH